MKLLIKVILFSSLITSLLNSHNILQRTNNLKELLEQAAETQINIINILKKAFPGSEIIDPGIKNKKQSTDY